MIFLKKDGATITVVKTGVSYHTYNDLNLCITNACSISEPEADEEFLYVKGRNGYIDISEAITGYTTYKSRQIAIELAGMYEAREWDSKISMLRNLFDGKEIKVVFDNDIGYFWTGRCHVTGFKREMNCGFITLEIPQADPYKYTVQTFNEDYLWDPFNFETGIATEQKTTIVDGTAEVLIPRGAKPVVPVVTVESINTYIRVKKGVDGRLIYLKVGENELSQIMVNGEEETRLIFEGNGIVIVNFRGASL